NSVTLFWGALYWNGLIYPTIQCVLTIAVNASSTAVCQRCVPKLGRTLSVHLRFAKVQPSDVRSEEKRPSLQAIS
ncbi:hypothetical protein AAVH_42060, partial [Aphelenchoides avenae]